MATVKFLTSRRRIVVEMDEFESRLVHDAVHDYAARGSVSADTRIELLYKLGSMIEERNKYGDW